MLQATKEAYYEVDTILDFLNQSYVDAIPLKLRKKFKENKAENYKKKIVPYKQLNEQNLKDETLAILAVLNYKYWCKDEEKKKQLMEMYSENENKYPKELREQYNPDYLFKKDISRKYNEELKENNTDKMIVVIKKENVFNRIINRIKSILKRNK